MSYIDYEFKAKVLNEHADLIKDYKRSSLFDYALQNLNKNGVVMKCLQTYNFTNTKTMLDLHLYCENNDLQKEFKEVKKIVKAQYVRTERLQHRVADMLLNGSCLFVTLTFKDEVLSSTTDKERRLLVVRYLKACNGRYVANIDFGSKNHREHYHALIQSNHINHSGWHKYGAIKTERVRNRSIETDKVRLSKYIAKLSNHCIKETTKRSALIYSRT